MEFFALSGPIFAFLGATTAAVLTAVGSSLGVAIAGQAATGLSSEKPELAGKALILEALPSSQAVYGLVVAFLIISVDNLSGVSPVAGIQYLIAALPIGIAGLISGYYQGRILAGGMNMLARGEENLGKAILFGVMVETFAILGFLISVLMILGVK